MRSALDLETMPAELRTELWNYFEHAALFMVNTLDES
jgi:hypothetical protein